MLPVLFSIGSYPIHTYGVLIALGFLFAVYLVRAEAKRQSWPTELIVDWCFLALLFGFIGARLVFVLTRFSDFMKNPIEIFYVWEGGLVFYGGPLLAVPFTLWFVRRHKLSLSKLGDIAVQGLVLAHAFGRFGCLSAGCCFGKPTEGGWGIKFHSELIPIGLRDVPLHPTQLYEAGSLLALFFFMRYWRKRARFDGEITLIYFLIYPILRSIIEIFRGDSIRGFVIQDVLSTSQFISLIVFSIALFLYIRAYRDLKSRS